MSKKKRSGKPEAQPRTEVPVRQFPRVPSRQSVLLRKIGGPVQGRLVSTETVGLGGCCFAHSEPQEEGSTLYLTILVGHEVAEARVQVVYCRPRTEGTYEVGVAFAEIAPKDRLLLEKLFHARGGTVKA